MEIHLDMVRVLLRAQKADFSNISEVSCCDNHLSQRQMITQAVNLLSWISSGKFTRELNKKSLLN